MYIVVCECWICMTITAVHVVSECWAINKADLQRIDALDHWCLYKESLVFVGMILSEMLTFVIWPISHHSHPSSSLVVFLSLGILQERMRMQTPAKSFLSLLLRAGDVHLGGHVLPSWRPSLFPASGAAWSQRTGSESTSLSGNWCLCVVLCTSSGTCYCWIGLDVLYGCTTVLCCTVCSWVEFGIYVAGRLWPKPRSNTMTVIVVLLSTSDIDYSGCRMLLQACVMSSTLILSLTLWVYTSFLHESGGYKHRAPSAVIVHFLYATFLLVPSKCTVRI